MLRRVQAKSDMIYHYLAEHKWDLFISAIRLMLTNRKTLQPKALDIQNDSRVRGTLKAFGLKVGKLIKKLLKKQDLAPTRIVTDKFRAYTSAFRAIGLRKNTIAV